MISRPGLTIFYFALRSESSIPSRAADSGFHPRRCGHMMDTCASSTNLQPRDRRGSEHELTLNCKRCAVPECRRHTFIFYQWTSTAVSIVSVEGGRQKIGFDSCLPDSGVVIMFVDESRGSGQSPVKIIDPDTQSPSHLPSKAFKVGQKLDNETYYARIEIKSSDDQSFTLVIDRSGAPLLTIQLPYPSVNLTIDGNFDLTDQTGYLKSSTRVISD